MFIWIWQLKSKINEYGSIGALISKLKSLNINNVCIKYHEGSSGTGGGVNFKADFLAYADSFKREGFKVGTWGYNYFNNLTNESNLIIEALNNSDYYIFDAEIDVANKFKQAEQVCKTVRNAHPNALIGYSSFPIVSYHEDIPYEVFNKYCDFASPQAYWGEMQWNVDKCIDDMLKNYEDYNLNKPIYPSIQTYEVSYASYAYYAKYKFNLTGAWSLDEMDSNFEKFSKDYNDGGDEKKVKTLIVYGEGADQRAAEYLADYLKSPICSKNNLTQDTINSVETFYMVGGTWKPTTNTILLSGKDRYETMQVVLEYIGK